MPTIGVSIAVPEPWGRQLQDYRVSLGDEAARLIPTHITLLPPYEANETECVALDRHLDAIASSTSPFRLHLRGTGTFRPVSPVVFLNVVAGISECEQLSKRIQGGPVSIETRFPYHPHVTVAHDVPEAGLDRAFEELAGFDRSFEVSQFHRYEFHDTAGWTESASYRLSSRA